MPIGRRLFSRYCIELINRVAADGFELFVVKPKPFVDMRNNKRISFWAVLPLFLCFFLGGIGARAVPAGGGVAGRVVTSDGAPAGAVTVSVKETNRWVTTDADGRFHLDNLLPGNYTLSVSLVGYRTEEQAVKVTAGQTVEVAFSLALSEKQLEEVIVSGGYNRFATPPSEYVAKLPLKNLENPQVYNVIPASLMKEQLVTDFQSALDNVPGGAVMQNPDGSIFIMLRGFEAYSTVRNGISVGAGNFGNVDPVNLERIEVLKGPAGTLFGSSVSSYGGLVNRVTKKPYDTFGGEIGYSWGMWDLSRLTVDVNSPLNQDKTALFRFNGALNKENGWQDAGGQNHWTAAPSFLYKVNERLTLSLDAEVTNFNDVTLIEGGQGLANLSAKNYGRVAIPYTSSFTGSDVKNSLKTTNVFANAEYRLSLQWTSNTIFSSGVENEDEYNMVFLNFINDSLLSRNVYASRGNVFSATDIQQDFTGRFSTGYLRHRLVLGLDLYSYQVKGPSAYFQYDDSVNFTKAGTDNMSVEQIDAGIAANGMSDYLSKQHTLAAYGSDVVNVTDNLLAMVSARLDHFVSPGSYNQTAVSPKFGLVYQPVKDKIALFANYMNGFQNQNGHDFSGTSFHPQQANQVEAGIKSDLAHGRVSITATYYDILVKNILITDTAHPAFSIQSGSQRSQGFEGELIANPVTGWNIVAGYGYNDNKYVDEDQSLVGKRPVESPANTVNCWTSYKWLHGALKGWVLGFGGNYVSKTFMYFDADNDCPLPAYTVLRTTIGYDQPKWSAGIRINNLTNEKYWNTNAQAQAPLQVTGTLSFRF